MRVQVRCTVALTALGLPGLGDRQVTRTVTAPLDVYRSRAMSRRAVRAARQDRERGSVTLMAVVLALGLLSMLGLVIDGGAKLTATRTATDLAEQAARAGAQAVRPAALRDSQAVLDPAAAETAARGYLTAADPNTDWSPGSGTTTVTVTPDQVTVTLTRTAPTRVLGLLGIGTVEVHGTGTAAVLLGVTTPETETP